MTDADPHHARRSWMSVLARASATELRTLLATCPDLPAHARLRGPESGLVMLRGRAGGGGAPFNLGEASVTRCSVRNEAGAVGHAYVMGRDAAQAELAAALDAALQDPDRRPALEAGVVAVLAGRQRDRREVVARKAEATRVQFFTMANMRS